MCSATTMLLALVPPGGHIVTTTDCYRRTRQFIQTVLPKMGITVRSPPRCVRTRLATLALAFLAAATLAPATLSILKRRHSSYAYGLTSRPFAEGRATRVRALGRRRWWTRRTWRGCRRR
jgi:hypothetical protein